MTVSKIYSVSQLEVEQKINEIIDNLPSGTVSNARNIGEIVQSTLPLNDAGLHLLDGSLLNGSGIYAQFVDYIAALYTEVETTWMQPVLTSNGTFGGNSFAVSASSFAVGNIDRYPYMSFDGNSATKWGVDNLTSGWLTFYNPDPLKVSSIIYTPSSDFPTEDGGNLEVLGSNDNLTWTSLWTGTYIGGISSTMSINSSSYYNYYRISITNGTSNWVGLGNLTINATYKKTPNYFTDETSWQNQVTITGSCGKFVYNSTNNTVRLPKISDILQGTTSVNALGNLIEAGLPNMTTSTAGGHNHDRGNMEIWGNFEIIGDHPYVGADGSFYIQNIGMGGNPIDTSPDGGSDWRMSFNASRTWTGNTSWNGDHTHSVSWGANTDTVQPQTIKVLYYIVVATSTKTEIEVDIDNIATDLNGKADRDLSNLSATGQSIINNKANISLSNVNNTAKVLMSGMSMPGNRYIDLTLGASGAIYTAPANGWFSVETGYSGQNGWLRLCNIPTGIVNQCITPFASAALNVYVPARSGDNVLLAYDNSGSLTFFRFIYAQGSESEAS